jgi:hypothetical protein
MMNEESFELSRKSKKWEAPFGFEFLRLRAIYDFFSSQIARALILIRPFV